MKMLLPLSNWNLAAMRLNENVMFGLVHVGENGENQFKSLGSCPFIVKRWHHAETFILNLTSHDIGCL